MNDITRRHVASITPAQALFVTALLAVSGSSERTRHSAINLFQRGAISAVWAFLGRHTHARVSWLRLVSITHEATARFLNAWPTSCRTTPASMMASLEMCVNAAASRVPGPVRTAAINHSLGVLTLLDRDERLHLLHCVQSALTQTHLCVLHATVENERAGTPNPGATGADLGSAIEHLESLLLAACTYTLGAPEGSGCASLAA